MPLFDVLAKALIERGAEVLADAAREQVRVALTPAQRRMVLEVLANAQDESCDVCDNIAFLEGRDEVSVTWTCTKCGKVTRE